MNVAIFISDKAHYKPKLIQRDMEEQCVIFSSKDKSKKILKFKTSINNHKGTQVHKINITTADPQCNDCEWLQYATLAKWQAIQTKRKKKQRYTRANYIHKLNRPNRYL